ncbi:hypothetical protein HELRODRAFT_74671, partial [Helobdella robusta]|uniref:Protein YIPF n=1 Tax=Helobdella robusta TaxID=6412 RepID=T1G1T8_HELRO
SGEKSQPSFLQFKYYQSFFDVDTKQVLARIIGSMYPNIRSNYLQTQIRPKPDYYGPFWICTTLILSIAISGNMANYFASHNSSKDFKWQYDFHKVTMATFVIYTYWLIMPSLIYGFLRWHGNQGNYFFSELVCLYGYSLFIYIPVSVLWLIPLIWLQWTLVLVGMCLSGVVLALNVWPSVREEKKKVSLSLLACILLMHGLLAVGFMVINLTFFTIYYDHSYCFVLVFSNMFYCILLSFIYYHEK